MDPVAELTFRGIGGDEYRFCVYPKNVKVKEGPALYSFLRKENGKFYVLYIGQTIDMVERMANHHKWDEATRKGFNYLGICRDVPVWSLEAVEARLIQAYHPSCNEQVPQL